MSCCLSVGCADVESTLTQGIAAGDGGAVDDVVLAVQLGIRDAAGPIDSAVQPAIVRNASGLRRRLRWSKDPLPNQRDAQFNQIVVKLVDNSGLRVRNNRLVAEIAPRTADDEDRMRYLGLDPTSLESERRRVQTLVGAEPNLRLSTPVTDEAVMAQARAVAERSLGHEIADLSSFVTIELPRADRATADEWLTRLRSMDIVETAYYAPSTTLPRSTPGCADQLPSSVGFAGLGESNQRYIRARPSATQWIGQSGATRMMAGLDVVAAWSVPGGTGTGAKVFDIEFGFTEEHEDLPNISVLAGCININDNFILPMSQTRHGTATMGVLVGCRQNPDFGFTGVAHGASAYFSGAYSNGGSSAPAAISRVINSQLPIVPNVGWGSTILLEQQTSMGQPLEIDLAVFAGIQTATGLGYTFVEPSGNGSLLLDNMSAGGAALIARYPGDPAYSGAVMVGAMSQDATVDGRHLTANVSCGGSRLDVSAWGTLVDTLGYPDTVVNGVGDANQWYTTTASFGATSSASAIIAGAVTSVLGMAIAANSQVPIPRPWHLLNLIKRTALPSDSSTSNPATGPRNGGPTLQLGMVAAVFADKAMPFSISNFFFSKIEATQVQYNQVHVHGVNSNGNLVHNVLQGGAWHGWRTFPYNGAGVAKISLTDSTPLFSATRSVDAWGLDGSGRLIWSQRLAQGVSDYGAWVLGDVVTGLQHVTTTVYDPNYVNGFAVTATGQLRWYYRPINSVAFYLGSPAFPIATTLASKIVAVPSPADVPFGRPPRVDLFAVNTGGQLVHAWVSGANFYGWDIVRPAETDVGQIDAVFFRDQSDEIIVAYGRAQSTTIGRISILSNTESWTSVNVPSPRGLALASHNAFGPLSGTVRLFSANSLGVIQEFTVIQGASWIAPVPAGTSTWSSSTNFALARSQYFGTSLVFAVPPGGTPVYRVSDPIFPQL